jgi:hypothetical protein
MDEREMPGDEESAAYRAWAAQEDAYEAWVDREIAAGRLEERVPEEWEIEGPAISLSLGDATDIDPELLASICGPDGLGGEALGPQFGQHHAADALRPTPVLMALTEQAVSGIADLTDDELLGALHAARRLENRAAYLQTLEVAEFGRRRATQLADATGRGVRPGQRPGEHADLELSGEMLISRGEAGSLLDAADGLATRLPRTLEGMAAGLIDARRASIIAFYTGSLRQEHAAQADEILAKVAIQVRPETLASRAAALEMKLDPQAVRDRREHAKRTRQRVEVRREMSGNASVAGRELDPAVAMASKANIHGLALRLRRSGLPGTLDALRTLVFNDLLQSRNPLDRISASPAIPTRAEPPVGDGDPADDARMPDDATDGSAVIDDWSPGQIPPPEAPADDDGEPADGSAEVFPGADEVSDYEDGEDINHGQGGQPDSVPEPDPTPMPAVINLLVHAGTLLGWDTTPSQAAGWGLLDPADTRAMVRAASQHPGTRWAVTLLGADGTAVAHGLSAGQHPWEPAEGATASQGAQLADLLRRLNVTLQPIARKTCDHASAENRYRPSRKLKDLLRARTATCTAPGCQAQAIFCDQDHTIPYPNGPTCQCNLGPKCRTHHRAKQAPDWKLEQTQPGVFRWTFPSGRTHTTGPTVYA